MALKRCASDLALQKNIFAGHSNSATVGPMDFTYEECLEIFQTISKWQLDYNSYFVNHQKIDVFYEDLADAYAVKVQQIQNFLGVKYEPLSPSTKKQNRLPLAAAISNYRELKESFKGSRWAHLFEE